MLRAGSRVLGAVCLALAAGGCPGLPGGDDPDARPTDDDGGDDTAGIELYFLLTPDGELPLSIGGDVTVDQVKLRVADLCVFGDAASCDERTSRATLELDWHEADAPAPVRFMSAPPGLYSRVEFRLDDLGGDYSYRIEGTVRLPDDSVHDFQIEDSATIPLGFNLDGVSLQPNQIVRLDVTLDLPKLLQEIDWSLAEVEEDGSLSIDDRNPGLLIVRLALEADAIEVTKR